MKYCPQCQKRFNEAWLSFCPDDGTPLNHELTPPSDPNWDPKIRRPQVLTPDEQETQWLPKDAPLPGSWIPPDERRPMNPAPWQPPPPPSTYLPKSQPSQGIAIASMITGIAGVVMLGCFGPIPGIVALVLGTIALNQIKKSPDKYTGKPYATAGVIIGGMSVAFYVVVLIWALLARALS